MKLTDLEPHFLYAITHGAAYEYTDDIERAVGLALQCPACFWSSRGGAAFHAHQILLWKSRPAGWRFIGHNYADVSLVQQYGLPIAMVGGCGTFTIKKGYVDFA